ncbi:MAG: NAD(P)/FAD-dependent oxidoreductase [Aquabacterium sp.]
MNRSIVDVAIVGAGPAGLAVAACLKRQGRSFVLLERQGNVGSAWRTHYDRLHLHTDKAHSSLPHYKLPSHYPRYPSRQQVVDYLEAYARYFDLRPHFNEEVRDARRMGDVWDITTSQGRHQARTLVVAAGYNNQPNIPQWPGQDRYKGTILHSKQYRNAAVFKDQNVLVVGLGNSGGELLIDLWEHGARPSIAVRSPVNVIPREVLGTPFLTMGILQSWLPSRLADALNAPVTKLIIGDLRPYGLRQPAEGPITQIREQGRVPFIDVGTIRLIKDGHVKVHPNIERFTEHGVVFTDGQQRDFQAVVLATGFKPAVDRWLHAGASAMDAQGTPASSGQPVPGQHLYFCGYHISPTGMLREIAREALAISKSIGQSVKDKLRQA